MKKVNRVVAVILSFVMVLSLPGMQSMASEIGELQLTDRLENLLTMGMETVSSLRASTSTVKYTGEDGVVYTFNSSTGTITNASITSPTDVVIPSEIDGVAVVAINNSGFYENDNVLSVTFPSSVETIADYTFGLCENLTTVVFETSEETVTDEDGNETTVLKGITTIGEGVFWRCYGITSVTLPETLESISVELFSECTSLTQITFPESVQEIGESGLWGTGLTEVTIPGTVKTIGATAFAECARLETLTIEEGVETIGTGAFYECTALEEVNMPDTMTEIESAAFTLCTSLTSFVVPGGITTLSAGILDSCSSLVSVSLPDSLEEINSGAFINCTSLEKLVIPDNVTFIGEHAFSSDTSLKSVTLGESVTTLEGYVFFHCYALEKIVIPDSVVYIGEHAFNYCTSLTSVTFGNSLQIIDESAFWFCTALTDLVMPDSLETIGDYAFRGCSAIVSLQLNEGLLSIGEEAFCDCFVLEELVLPDSLVSLGASAFKWCGELKSLVIGSGLTEIADEVFSGAGSLESLEFRGTVTAIGEKAFWIPSSLQEINFPNGLLTIGTMAFANGNIEKIVIPSSVTEIADEAFYTNCTLAEAWIYSRDAVFGTDVFTWASDDFTIYGYAGSTAEAYAEEYSFNFVDIETMYRDLTVTVCDSEGNEITDGYTVTWYDADQTVLSEGDAVLSGATSSQSYIVEVTLGFDLLENYEQPEQYEIAPEDAADCVITLSPISKVTLTGQITDTEGNSLSGVTVTATRAAYGTEYTAQTDADGAYSMEVPCDSLTVKMQKDGYYSHRETLDLSEETAESYDLSYALYAAVTDRIVLDITVYGAVAEGEESTGQTLTSANTLNFTLTDADGNAITGYEVQGTSILFEPDVVTAGEEVTVSVSDTTGTYVSDDSVTVTLDADKIGSASLSLTEKGGFVFSGLTGADATMTVYDSSNTSVLSETVVSGKSYTGLDAGEYTIILIQKTALLKSTASPDVLSELGLTEGTDYLKLSVTVKDGEIVTLSDYEVPALDESKISYVSSAAVTTGLASGMMPGAQFTLRVTYTVDETKDVTPGYVQIVFPEGISPASDRIALVDGTMTTYTYNSSARTAMVNVSGKDRATVYLYCEAGSTAGAYDISAYLTLSGDILQPLGTAKATVNASSISAPEKTSSEMIVVSGITAANSTVTIYDNGEVIGTAVSNAAGSWSTTVTLAGKLYTYSYHAIYASIESEQFEEALVTEETMVIYDERAIVVKSVTMYNQGIQDENNETVFDFTSDDTTVPYYSYLTKYPTFTFTAELESGSNEWIEALYVYTVDNYGDITYVEMTYDESLGVWYGTHDYTDSMTAPTQVGVAYDTTVEYQMIPEDDSEYMADMEEALDEVCEALFDCVEEAFGEYFESCDYVYDEDTGLTYVMVEDEETGEETCIYVLKVISETITEDVTEDQLSELGYSYSETEGIWFRMGCPEEGIYQVSSVDYNQKNALTVLIGFPTEESAEVASLETRASAAYGEAALSSVTYSVTPLLSASDWYYDFSHAVSDSDAGYWWARGWDATYGTSFALGQSTDLLPKNAKVGGTSVGSIVSVGQLLSSLAMDSNTIINIQRDFKTNYEILDSELSLCYEMLELTCKDGSMRLSASDKDTFVKELQNLYGECREYYYTGLDRTNAWESLLQLYLIDLMGTGYDMLMSVSKFSKVTEKVSNVITAGGVSAIKENYLSSVENYKNDTYNELKAEFISLKSEIINAYDCDEDKEPDPDEQTPALPAEVEHDPSGYVYEAVPSNRLEGVTAVISYNDNGTETVWDASNYNQVNPQITGADGSYKWDVTIGEWKVTFTKDGYLTADTTQHENANEDGWLPVPPPQLEINIGMISTEAPTVESVTAYTDQIEVVFSQYMDMESEDTANVLNAISLTRDGEEVDVTVTSVDAEYNLEGTLQYATRFAIVPADGDISGELILTVDESAENYAGTPLGTSYISETLTVMERPTSITMPNSTEVVVHEEASISVELNPCIADKTLIVEMQSSDIVSVGETSVVTDENGKAVITVTGELPGTGYIVVTEPISGVSATIEVNVVLESEGEDDSAVKPVTVYLDDGIVVTSGMTIPKGSFVTLVTETEGATIRYTVNDTCPCKEAALYYTEPIEITEDTVLRAAAVADGVYSSTIRLELSVSNEIETEEETGEETETEEAETGTEEQTETEETEAGTEEQTETIETEAGTTEQTETEVTETEEKSAEETEEESAEETDATESDSSENETEQGTASESDNSEKNSATDSTNQSGDDTTASSDAAGTDGTTGSAKTGDVAWYMMIFLLALMLVGLGVISRSAAIARRRRAD